MGGLVRLKHDSCHETSTMQNGLNFQQLHSPLSESRRQIRAVKVLDTNPALAAERRNVYRHVAKKKCLAPEERNVLFGTNVSLLRSLGVVWVVIL